MKIRTPSDEWYDRLMELKRSDLPRSICERFNETTDIMDKMRWEKDRLRDLLHEFEFARFLKGRIKDDFKEYVTPFVARVLNSKVKWTGNPDLRYGADWFTSIKWLGSNIGTLILDEMHDLVNIVKSYQRQQRFDSTLQNLDGGVILFDSPEYFKELNMMLYALSQVDNKVDLFKEAILEDNDGYIDRIVGRQVWDRIYISGFVPMYEFQEKIYWPFKYLWESKKQIKDQEVKGYLLALPEDELKEYLGYMDNCSSIDVMNIKPCEFFENEIGQKWLREISKRNILIEVVTHLIATGYSPKDKRFHDRLFGMRCNDCTEVFNQYLEKPFNKKIQEKFLPKILKDFKHRILPIEYGEFRT